MLRGELPATTREGREKAAEEQREQERVAGERRLAAITVAAWCDEWETNERADRVRETTSISKAVSSITPQVSRSFSPTLTRSSEFVVGSGSSSYEGSLLDDPPRLRGENVLLAGPVTADTAIRGVKLPRHTAYSRLWDPSRPAVEVAVELTDGRTWTVTSRPCAEVAPEYTHIGTCFETRIGREDVPPHRHMAAFFNVDHGWHVDVCDALTGAGAAPDLDGLTAEPTLGLP